MNDRIRLNREPLRWHDLPETERQAIRRRYLHDFIRVKADEELIAILAHDPSEEFETHCADWFEEEGTMSGPYTNVHGSHGATSFVADSEGHCIAGCDSIESATKITALLNACADIPNPEVVPEMMEHYKAIRGDLGFMEWSCPEHAERLLVALINAHTDRARDILTRAGVKL